ncbi:pyrroline-5-carboxylate reductase [Brevibacillus dissolubilis]|uniref:pyrroline-5-carboxylate reductase n=1 Tax=Brevibacillus dissolubilis TaxID=1844116 RepID=UPI001115F3AB|nr:pyrroline-5-carboxylate reductase [Brevibacillus dissolubilis]
MLKNKKVAFIGAGSMAEAMIAGMVATGTLDPGQLIVTNRSNLERRQEITQSYGVHTCCLDDPAAMSADIIILAVKPKDAECVLDALHGRIKEDQLVMSVLAGISTQFIEDRLGSRQPVVRVMPNTSSMVGESATAIARGQYVTDEQLVMAEQLLTSIGNVTVIDEEQMSIFTGIAGSGPAYVYYLVEHMEKAGQEGGLDAATAREIAVQTIYGASKMLLETEEDPATLRENVTSPNGTTAAGLEALEKYGGGEAIEAAIKHAAQRSDEISAQYER